MNYSTFSRSTLFYVLVTVALLTTLVGCPSTDDTSNGPAQQPETSSTQTDASHQPSVEPVSTFGTAEAPIPLPDSIAESTLPATQSERPESPSGEPQRDEQPPPGDSRTPDSEGPGVGSEDVEEPLDGSGQRANPLRSGSSQPLRGGMDQTTSTDASAQPPPEGKQTSNAHDATHQGQSHEDKHTEEPFDPIKVNGPIFEGWPEQLKLALVITGRLDGYLEPCGCAGLDRMQGGLSRRHTMFRKLREKGWPVVGLDVGGLVDGFGPQAELKFQMTTNALQLMKYDAVAWGKTDLQFPVGNLISAAVDEASPFISANAALYGFAEPYTPQKKIVEIDGMKLGITAVLGSKWQKEVDNQYVAMADPREKLSELVPQLDQECELLILLVHATEEETIELAKAFSQLDVVVTAGGPPLPPDGMTKIEGTEAVLVQVGEKGMNAVVLGFTDDPKEPILYQRVPLDSRFAGSPEMKLLMETYQDQLKEEGLEGLEIRTVPRPRSELLGEYVGSKKCESCHEPSYEVWKKSGHAKGWETLVELDPPRNHDPECIACHVVGWHPQNLFPYEGGFLDVEKTPELIDVGCETCHGPGKAHVDAEMGSDDELQETLRKAIVITKQESQQAVTEAIIDRQPCRNCHDLDNSPYFDFETYWPKIEHKED